MTGLMRRMQHPRMLSSEMERLFEGYFGMTPVHGEHSTVWSPAVDIREDEGSFSIEVDLPGLGKDDIQLEVERNTLSIKGERRFANKEQGENYHFVERSYGSFCRSFNLPRNVDADRISAEHHDGVLIISVPKVAEAKPKQVEISN